jgi:hypothetical protein
VKGRSEKDIRKALHDDGRVDREDKEWFRSYVPGFGKLKHYRITGPGLIPETKDPADRDPATMTAAEKLAAGGQAMADHAAMAAAAERAMPDTVH